MTGLDCNILVQLAFEDHPRHAAAVQAETNSGHRLLFPPLIITEFLHVSTDARRFDPPLTMAEALDWIEELLAKPSYGLIEPAPASVPLTFRA